MGSLYLRLETFDLGGVDLTRAQSHRLPTRFHSMGQRLHHHQHIKPMLQPMSQAINLLIGPQGSIGANRVFIQYFIENKIQRFFFKTISAGT